LHDDSSGWTARANLLLQACVFPSVFSLDKRHGMLLKHVQPPTTLSPAASSLYQPITFLSQVWLLVAAVLLLRAACDMCACIRPFPISSHMMRNFDRFIIASIVSAASCILTRSLDGSLRKMHRSCRCSKCYR
jgi:hypothetical protein